MVIDFIQLYSLIVFVYIFFFVSSNFILLFKSNGGFLSVVILALLFFFTRVFCTTDLEGIMLLQSYNVNVNFNLKIFY